MFDPTFAVKALASYNETVREADEVNANLYVSAPIRLSTDFQESRTALLHCVMHHRPHQAEY